MTWKLFACLGLFKVNAFIIWIQAQSFQWPTMSIAHSKSNRQFMPVMLGYQTKYFPSPSLPLLCALNISATWYTKSACQWFMNIVKVCLNQYSEIFIIVTLFLWLRKCKNITDFICKSCKSTKLIQKKDLAWQRHLRFRVQTDI